MNLADQLSETVGFVRARCALKPRIGIILGSGLGNFAESIDADWSAEYSSIPHFERTSVEGHSGRLILGRVDGIPVAALQGRIHLYEGFSISQVVHPTRALAMLGIEALLITNAAGGLGKGMRPGDFMAISDHINLMGDNPLRGKNMDEWGPRFPDMTEAYDKIFMKVALACAKKSKLRLSKGVYVGVPGPTYETPAEIRYLKAIGGDAVGMSTVPEVIAANHFGVRVCGVSCITNLAAGIAQHKLSHKDVTAMAKIVESKFATFVTTLIKQIGEQLDGPAQKRK